MLKAQLISIISSQVRGLNRQNPLKAVLDEEDVNAYIDKLISVVYLYTRPKKGGDTNILFAEVVCAIGNTLRSHWGVPRHSGNAAKLGGFLLYAFEEANLVEVILGAGKNGHNTYVVTVTDDQSMLKLWTGVVQGASDKLPSVVPYVPWTSTLHETGARMIKTGSTSVLRMVTPENNPLIFEAINKSQSTGWRVNQYVQVLQKWAFRNKESAFNEIWTSQNKEAKATKMREAKQINAIADKFIYKTFYHLYYYDFRSRKYPSTAYLHEQGTDQAKGLLLRKDSLPIGKEGFFWLCFSIASNWGGDTGWDDGNKTDKIPLKERERWVMENEDTLLDYVMSFKSLERTNVSCTLKVSKTHLKIIVILLN
jgi:DNA-directed RNA polymerase